MTTPEDGWLACSTCGRRTEDVAHPGPLCRLCRDLMTIVNDEHTRALAETAPEITVDPVLALYHDDGHVAGIASLSVPAQAGLMRAMYELITAMGCRGWHCAEMPLWDATRGYMAMKATEGRCALCALVLPCGCTPHRAMAHQCPHDGLARLRAAVEHIKEKPWE